MAGKAGDLTRPRMIYGDSSPSVLEETINWGSPLSETDTEESPIRKNMTPKESTARLVRTYSRRPAQARTPVVVTSRHEPVQIRTPAEGISRYEPIRARTPVDDISLNEPDQTLSAVKATSWDEPDQTRSPVEATSRNEPNQTISPVAAIASFEPVRARTPVEDILHHKSVRSRTPDKDIPHHKPVRSRTSVEDIPHHKPARSRTPVEDIPHHESVRYRTPVEDIPHHKPVRTRTPVEDIPHHQPVRSRTPVEDIPHHQPVRSRTPVATISRREPDPIRTPGDETIYHHDSSTPKTNTNYQTSSHHKQFRTKTPVGTTSSREPTKVGRASIFGTPVPRFIDENNRSINVSSLEYQAPRPPTVESRNKINHSRKSKQGRFHISTLGQQSRSTNYYHGDIVDDNLLISASKLDNTLFRLFSHARDNKDIKNKEDLDSILMPFLHYSQSDLISMEPVMWCVYPMDAAQRETLDQELPYIEDNIAPTDVMKEMYKKEVLTHMDYNQLLRTEGQGDRAVTRLMIKTLQRRGDKAYPAFLQTLKSHNYTHISERLSATERSLRGGMMADSSDYNRTSIDVGNIGAHRYRSGRTTSLRDASAQGTNENVSRPDDVVLPANHQSSAINDIQLANHGTPRLDHVTSPSYVFTNQVSNLDSSEPSDQQIIDSRKLEKQLRDLMTELEAIQRDLSSLKCSPSPTDNQTNETEAESREEVDILTSQGVSSVARRQRRSTLPEQHFRSACDVRSQGQDQNHISPDDSSHRRTQKSGSCIVL